VKKILMLAALAVGAYILYTKKDELGGIFSGGAAGLSGSPDLIAGGSPTGIQNTKELPVYEGSHPGAGGALGVGANSGAPVITSQGMVYSRPGGSAAGTPYYGGQQVQNLATGNINVGTTVAESNVFSKTYSSEGGTKYETVSGPTGPLYTITRK